MIWNFLIGLSPALYFRLKIIFLGLNAIRILNFLMDTAIPYHLKAINMPIIIVIWMEYTLAKVTTKMLLVTAS